MIAEESTCEVYSCFLYILHTVVEQPEPFLVHLCFDGSLVMKSYIKHSLYCMSDQKALEFIHLFVYLLVFETGFPCVFLAVLKLNP